MEDAMNILFVTDYEPCSNKKQGKLTQVTYNYQSAHKKASDPDANDLWPWVRISIHWNLGIERMISGLRTY